MAELVQEVFRHWPGQCEDRSDPRAVHEAKLLNLATDKSFHLMGWKPVWDFTATIQNTVEWYCLVSADPALAPSHTLEQIECYENDARMLNLTWSL